MTTLADRRTFEPRAYGDWALKAAARLETACPGFLLRTFYASSLKRQALFAALADLEGETREAEIGLDDPGGSGTATIVMLRELAVTFATSDAKQIVETVFGSCPRSYLVLLAQIGEAPIASKTFYRTAFEACERSDSVPTASPR